ncbi:MAG: hypothetical protein ACAF41_00770 (plasmid) [Leptolyngbya sp. BL-A-14]
MSKSAVPPVRWSDSTPSVAHPPALEPQTLGLDSGSNAGEPDGGSNDEVAGQ